MSAPPTARASRPAPPTSRSVRVPGFEVMTGTHAVGSALAVHWHDQPSLCYVLHGRFDEYSRGRALDCTSDTLKLTAVGEKHSDRFAHSDVRGVRVDVDPARFVDSPSIARLLDGEFYLRGSGARATFSRIVAELESGDDIAPLVVESALLELFARLAREHVRDAGRRTPAWLLRADEIVHTLFATPLTLSQVAHEVQVSPSALARAYRAQFGVSVGERVRRLRLEWAAEELRRSGEALSVIALKAGFYDQSHFTNAFHRTFGESPARYRARTT
ncbi:MAG: helix-turn-helix transcriptional regulator [Gemmatimonadaceae bacterium]|nr:helix-turn-helix transcriptional regulator [Gemmatimonadaceae bacterium]MCW5826880.1 helix-turn-helix transcriptional regulator [Gemmatimonadaceae bacterium]